MSNELVDMIEPNVVGTSLQERIYPFILDDIQYEGSGACHRLTKTKDSQIFVWRVETQRRRTSPKIGVRILCTRRLTDYGSVHTRIEIDEEAFL